MSWSWRSRWEWPRRSGQNRCWPLNTTRSAGLWFLDKAFTERLLEQLEDAQALLASMLTSRYIGPLRDEAASWAEKLKEVAEVLELWLEVQDLWQYLEAVFSNSLGCQGRYFIILFVVRRLKAHFSCRCLFKILNCTSIITSSYILCTIDVCYGIIRVLMFFCCCFLISIFMEYIFYIISFVYLKIVISLVIFLQLSVKVYWQKSFTI